MHTEVMLVVGDDGHARARIARALARRAACRLVDATDPGDALRVLDELGDDGRHEVVAELSALVPVTEAIGVLADASGRTALRAVVSVADAATLLDALMDDGFVWRGDEASGRAWLTATRLEYASSIVLVGWEPLPTSRLSTVMAVASHLAPTAAIALDRGWWTRIAATRPYGTEQDRAGWTHVLADAHAPAMTDPRVSAMHYEQVRPLHPGRLRRLLDDGIEPGRFGLVLRSAGLCRLATRPGVVGRWDHVGTTIELAPAAIDDDDEPLSIGQDLAFIGIGLQHDALAEALDRAAVDDEELELGPAAWASFDDPFPAWSVHRHDDP